MFLKSNEKYKIHIKRHIKLIS